MITRALRLLKLRTTDKVVDFFLRSRQPLLRRLPQKSAKVFGIEGSEQLVKRAEASAVANGLADKSFLQRAQFIYLTLEDWTALVERNGRYR